ncbi:MAG: VRR-NUC domain-containing protein [Bacteroides sp.]|nr:VRR-NUC domain-containing protein [Bacteroides sp.]
MKSRQIGITSEKDLERAACFLARQAGGECFKFLPFMVNGLPDRIVLLPGGRAAFVEFKSTGRKPTPLQQIRLDRLHTLGFPVFVVHDETTLNTLKEWMIQTR